MHAEVFLSYFLATILAVGVIATPTPADVEGASTTGVNTLFEKVENVASLGPPEPRPSEPVITPKAGDVPTTCPIVVARDLESLEKRTLGCVTATIDPNFGGMSVYACGLPNGHCINLSPDWSLNISSFRPDSYTFCKIFTGPNCSGTSSCMFGYPGHGNLGKWDNNMRSIKCWW